MSSTPASIRAVVLDLGEVVLRLDFRRLVTALAEGDGTSTAEAMTRLARWPLYDLFERGGISEADFLQAFNERTGKALDRNAFRELWNSVIVDEVPGTDALLEKLSQRVGLYALSNTSEPHLAHVLEKYPFFRHFRKVFASNEIGARKPERAAYEIALREIGVRAEQVLFVDDRAENVDGALRVGMHARIIRETPRDLLAALGEFGLLD